jgi:aminoglycoside phosphotransferase (APT) family kinase protein
MLSALANSAVPGLQVVSAQQLSLGQRNAALVHDVNNQAFVVSLPSSEAEESIASQQMSAAKALTEGLRSRMPFQVPKVLGTLDVQGRTLSVNDYLPGQSPMAKNLTAELAVAIGQALATIHQLPTSTLIDHQRPVASPLDSLREAAGIVDRTAATGLLPQSLLRRWETACEDRALWQFEATAIHGRMQLGRFLAGDNRILGVTGWRTFGVGDPALDMAWLSTPASQGFSSTVITAYHSARNHADRWIMHRARFWAELDVAKWLLHGMDLGNDSITQDATDMLVALNDRVSGDLDQALTQPISQAQHPLAP